jgi:hypothetical protein
MLVIVLDPLHVEGFSLNPSGQPAQERLLLNNAIRKLNLTLIATVGPKSFYTGQPLNEALRLTKRSVSDG